MSSAPATSVLAALDIGSSAIRMDIAEATADGRIRLLESLKKGVQLARDAFTDGTLSEESIRAACGVLRDFKKVMDAYGVARYRAVATSAVRESSNSDTFLHRVLMGSGLDVEILDGPEENRLTLAAVQASLDGSLDLASGRTLLVEVGGGSADVTLLADGAPIQSGTFPLGSVRLRAGAKGAAAPEGQVRLLRRQISAIVANVGRSIDLRSAGACVAVGGDVRLAASILRPDTRAGTPCRLPRSEFTAFAERIAGLSVDQLVRDYALSYLDAETLGPALLTYQQLLSESQATQVTISDATIRAGILRDLLPAEGGQRLERLTHHILTAARSLGRKYQYDERHAERVREIAEVIFDALRVDQRMDDTHRLYLQVAALLHDIGLFVSPRAHHKHSYYLIAASDLFGLRRRELEIIANVARYHRRALPQRTHAPFIALDRDDRVLVSRLAAILRIANALDTGHLQTVGQVKVIVESERLVLVAQSASDLTMERVALADAAGFFAEVFGRSVILREAEVGP